MADVRRRPGHFLSGTGTFLWPTLELLVVAKRFPRCARENRSRRGKFARVSGGRAAEVNRERDSVPTFPNSATGFPNGWRRAQRILAEASADRRAVHPQRVPIMKCCRGERRVAAGAAHLQSVGSRNQTSRVGGSSALSELQTAGRALQRRASTSALPRRRRRLARQATERANTSIHCSRTLCHAWHTQCQRARTHCRFATRGRKSRSKRWGGDRLALRRRDREVPRGKRARAKVASVEEKNLPRELRVPRRRARGNE